jgi:hypothetical protein
MFLVQRIALLVAGLVLLGMTLELIRRRRLREEYAVLWICTSVMILAFMLVPQMLFAVAGWLHLNHTVLMTFLCVLFLAAILLHYSVVISKQSDHEKDLAQELALLKDEIAKLRAALKESRRTPLEPKPKPPALRT